MFFIISNDPTVTFNAEAHLALPYDTMDILALLHPKLALIYEITIDDTIVALCTDLNRSDPCPLGLYSSSRHL